MFLHISAWYQFWGFFVPVLLFVVRCGFAIGGCVERKLDSSKVNMRAFVAAASLNASLRAACERRVYAPSSDGEDAGVSGDWGAGTTGGCGAAPNSRNSATGAESCASSGFSPSEFRMSCRASSQAVSAKSLSIVFSVALSILALLLAAAHWPGFK